jgi:hypothetical protein
MNVTVTTNPAYFSAGDKVTIESDIALDPNTSFQNASFDLSIHSSGNQLLSVTEQIGPVGAGQHSTYQFKTPFIAPKGPSGPLTLAVLLRESDDTDIGGSVYAAGLRLVYHCEQANGANPKTSRVRCQYMTPARAIILRVATKIQPQLREVPLP